MHYLMSFVLGFFFCLMFYPSKGNSETLSNEIRGRTLSEQIAVVNGQNPSANNSHGVRIINGQTGNVRRESAFKRQTRDICNTVYKDDRFGAMLCRDRRHRLREREFDRYYGLDD